MNEVVVKKRYASGRWVTPDLTDSSKKLAKKCLRPNLKQIESNTKDARNESDHKHEGPFRQRKKVTLRIYLFAKVLLQSSHGCCGGRPGELASCWCIQVLCTARCMNEDS
jgi:hypothetical protein